MQNRTLYTLNSCSQSYDTLSSKERGATNYCTVPTTEYILWWCKCKDSIPQSYCCWKKTKRRWQQFSSFLIFKKQKDNKLKPLSTKTTAEPHNNSDNGTSKSVCLRTCSRRSPGNQFPCTIRYLFNFPSILSSYPKREKDHRSWWLWNQFPFSSILSSHPRKREEDRREVPQKAALLGRTFCLKSKKKKRSRAVIHVTYKFPSSLLARICFHRKTK